MNRKAERWLKSGFIAGAIVDGLVLLPMLIPQIAELLWGFTGFTEIYYFAQGMGGSLMLGWTLLLLWAYRKPLERRFVSLLTLVVIVGIGITQILGITVWDIKWLEIIPSIVITHGLGILFGYGYYLSRPVR